MPTETGDEHFNDYVAISSEPADADRSCNISLSVTENPDVDKELFKTHGVRNLEEFIEAAQDRIVAFSSPGIVATFDTRGDLESLKVGGEEFLGNAERQKFSNRVAELSRVLGKKTAAESGVLENTTPDSALTKKQVKRLNLEVEGNWRIFYSSDDPDDSNASYVVCVEDVDEDLMAVYASEAESVIGVQQGACS